MRKTIHLHVGLLVICFLSCCIQSFAQIDTSYIYLNKDLNNTTQDDAVYAGISIRQDDAWHLTVFHVTSGKKVMSGYYKDSLLKMPDGIFETFYDEGGKKSRGYYNEGMKSGFWKEWNKAGHLTDSIYFENNSPTAVYSWTYSAANKLINYSYTALSGEKTLKNYNEKGKLTAESSFTGKAGESKTYHYNGMLFEHAKFDDKGRRTSFQFFKEDGSEMTDNEHEKEVEDRRPTVQVNQNGYTGPVYIGMPEFKGGRERFEALVAQNLKLPLKLSDSLHTVITIKFSFYLDKKGKAYNVKLIEPDDKELEKAVADVLSNMSPWDMKHKPSYGPIVPIIGIRR